jgi:hypothetical protein
MAGCQTTPLRPSVGQDLDPIIEGIARNGEPGVIWMDVSA